MKKKIIFLYSDYDEKYWRKLNIIQFSQNIRYFKTFLFTYIKIINK